MAKAWWRDSDYELFARLTKERDEARAQLAAINSLHGALAAINAMARERDEARDEASLAQSRLAEIAELVGEGGDGSAFGRVESMLATFAHRQEVLQRQRDEARAQLAAELKEKP